MLLNTRLKNNIRVVGEEVPFVRSVSIGIYIKNGSVDENLSNNGISHFIEHMFFKGTRTMSSKKLADDMARIGGRVNAYTSKEYVCFYAHVLTEHFDEVLRILSDMLQHSKIDPQDIEKEKDIILEEYTMYEDSPEEIVLDELHTTVWPGHSLGYNIIGTKDNIRSMTKEKLQDYIYEHYVGDNIVISVVGNISFDQVTKKLETAFSEIKRGKIITRNTSIQYIPGKKGFVKDVEQGHLAIAFPTVDYFSPDTYAVNVLSVLLGGGLNSRLFQSIREDKGLAYSIYSYVETFYTAGLFNTYAATNFNQIEEMYHAIMEEFEVLKQQGIDELELIETKEQIKSNLIIGMESMSSRMSHYGKDELLTGKIRKQDDLLEGLNQVTMDKVNELIQTIFKMDQVTVTLASRDIAVLDVL